MKDEKLNWVICPRCGNKTLLVSELSTTTGRTCYAKMCFFWDFKTKEASK